MTKKKRIKRLEKLVEELAAGLDHALERVTELEDMLTASPIVETTTIDYCPPSKDLS